MAVNLVRNLPIPPHDTRTGLFRGLLRVFNAHDEKDTLRTPLHRYGVGYPFSKAVCE